MVSRRAPLPAESIVGLQSGIELKEVDGPAVRQAPFDPADGTVQLVGSVSVVKAALLSGVTKAKAGDAVTRRAPITRTGTPIDLKTRLTHARRRQLNFSCFIGFLQATTSIGSADVTL